MKLNFENDYQFIPTLKVGIEVSNPDNEGWFPYEVKICYGEDKQMKISQTFTYKCLLLLLEKMNILLTNPEQVEVFEPFEPAFSLKMNNFDNEKNAMLWVFDLGFINHGYVTETGYGILIHVNKSEFEKNIIGLQNFVETFNKIDIL